MGKRPRQFPEEDTQMAREKMLKITSMGNYKLKQKWNITLNVIG